MDHTVRIGRVRKALKHATELNRELMSMGPPHVQAASLQAWGYYHLRENSRRSVARLADTLDYLQERNRPDVNAGCDPLDDSVCAFKSEG